MRDDNDKKKVFLMSGFSNFLEKDTLDMKIRRLGGICRLMETMYVCILMNYSRYYKFFCLCYVIPDTNTGYKLNIY